MSDHRESALRALVSDWQANGNSRGLGDPTDRVWFECAGQLLAVLDSAAPDLGDDARCQCGHKRRDHLRGSSVCMERDRSAPCGCPAFEPVGRLTITWERHSGESS